MPRSDFLLTARQRADARAALLLLNDSGIALEEAARVALDGKRRIVRILVSDAAERFLLSRVRKVTRRGTPLRSATLTWYEQFLNPIVRDLGPLYIDSISRARFTEWLHALQAGDTARTSIARAARALWRWCLAQNPAFATEDVTVGSAFSRGAQSETRRLVLTVKHTQAILAAAGEKRSAFALMLFAGVRPEEVAGRGKDWLTWEHVNVAERWIRIPAPLAKTGKTRLLEHLPDAVWRWLEPGELTAAVSPVSDRSLRQFAQRVAGITTWPYDCLRHTAATYLLAFARDAGRVAEWIGHEGRPTLLHQTYRGRLTLAHTQVNHAMAAAYLALRPDTAAARRRAAAMPSALTDAVLWVIDQHAQKKWLRVDDIRRHLAAHRHPTKAKYFKQSLMKSLTLLRRDRIEAERRPGGAWRYRAKRSSAASRAELAKVPSVTAP